MTDVLERSAKEPWWDPRRLESRVTGASPKTIGSTLEYEASYANQIKLAAYSVLGSIPSSPSTLLLYHRWAEYEYTSSLQSGAHLKLQMCRKHENDLKMVLGNSTVNG